MKAALGLSTAALSLSMTMVGPLHSAEIDFEGLPAGTIVSELSKDKGISGNVNGVVLVEGRNNIFPSTNAAVLFNSECIPGTISCQIQDRDIATPHEDFGGPGIGIGGAALGPYPNDTPLGNILILARNLVDADGDGLVDDPDDADVPGFINFDFNGIKKGKTGTTVVINSVTIMDIDLAEGEDPGVITFSGPGIPTATIAVFDTENGGVAKLDGIGLAGVTNVRVDVKGSSAFAGIEFDETQGGRDCWITTGGFHNAGVKSGGKDFTFGGNVGPPPSGSWEVVDHNTGDNFHSNNVSITECVEIEPTGPGQPGGKKGFTINQAFFEGIGRLNHVDGYPFTGFVIDRGEPSGKNGNDTDEFHIEVRDPITSLVVFETSFLLDGGNVQIHPPVGKPN